MSECKYKLSYKLEPVDKEDIPTPEGNDGACDAFIFHSILYEGGARSALVIAKDGRTKADMSSIELFKGMMDLGVMITRRNDLLGWQRIAVDTFVETIMSKLRENRQEQIENNRH